MLLGAIGGFALGTSKIERNYRRVLVGLVF